MSGAGPSAAGVHRSYLEIPARVRTWVESQLGEPVHDDVTQPGGMSPGCAARLRTASGRAGFVKAVGADLNPRTPELFRHEIAVLSRLPAAPYRPDVLATYDDGDWVALLLEDVDGRHPDLHDAAEAAAAWSIVATQARELTPAPLGLEADTLRVNPDRWAGRLATLADRPAVLPDWAADRVDELATRVASLADRLPIDSLCHWDVRDDNLLRRPDGSVVIVDWGMSRLGPAWGDLFVLCLTWAEDPVFDTRVAELDAHPATVTDLVLGLGGWLALQSRQPAPPGLSTLPAFRRRESRRLLAAAFRRLR